MRTVPFRTVLEDALGLAGYPYDGATQLQLDTAARFINRRLREAWEWGPWPEWTTSELRPFADDFDIRNTYGTGQTVYDPITDAYYECVQDLTTGIPVTTIGWWKPVNNVPTCITYEQRGKEKLGRVWSINKWDVFTNGIRDNLSYGFYLSPEGVEVLDCQLKRVWMFFSIRAPLFSAKRHDAGQGYRYGDVIYYPEMENHNLFPERGECYQADYDVDGNQMWRWVQFPMILQSYVTTAAGADLLRHYGQKQLAAEYDARAAEMLREEFDKHNLSALMNVRIPV